MDSPSGHPGRVLALVVLAALAAGSVFAVALVGCTEEGGGDEPTVRERAERPRGGRPGGRARHPRTVAPSRCPAGVPECASTEGEVFYVERIDPDGDGDAHFVIFDPQSITLPGVTAIDVRKGLRPHPLPGPGDLVSAAGPVQTGSYGQSQIHALEFHVAGE